ncbi:MAG: DUF2283 domain-containing protein [Pirellulales bacterium]|nr:DUF2283 domain-containing protein [Pirellulales bacterium]
MSEKNRFSFGVNVETHTETGEVIAVYLQIRKGKTKTTKEYANGDAFADYDKNGLLLGIELLAPCRASVLETIAKQPSTKQFVRDAVPRGMLVTS